MTSRPVKALWIIVGTVFGWVTAPVIRAEETYSFDVEEFTKKTWEWHGELSAAGTMKDYNQDSALYPVKFPQDNPSGANEAEWRLSLESRWDWDWSRLWLSGEAGVLYSSLPDSHEDSFWIGEAYWQIAEFEPHNLEIGKRLLRWGKGYAFNPVAFLERPKNPEDPEVGREGLWLVQGVWITGPLGPLSNSSLTLVGLPLGEAVNDDFRSQAVEETVWGFKFYGLTGTLDLDLYWVNWPESGETDRGIDFAANLAANFEVHGEGALRETTTADDWRLMLGLRYLTEQEVTWIAEWFHDSAGLTADESAAIFETIRHQPAVTVKPYLSLVQQQKTINRNYGYVKVSVKEPFNWLYFTPSLSWLGNLDDHSANTALELAYAPGNNWSYNILGQTLTGSRYSQYGENPVAAKLELTAVFSF